MSIVINGMKGKYHGTLGEMIIISTLQKESKRLLSASNNYHLNQKIDITSIQVR